MEKRVTARFARVGIEYRRHVANVTGSKAKGSKVVTVARSRNIVREKKLRNDAWACECYNRILSREDLRRLRIWWKVG